MSSARIAAYAVVAVLCAVIGVQFLRAIPSAAARERHKRANAACGAIDPPPQISNRALGRFPRPAPSFEARGTDDVMHPLSAYRGKVVFLNFWATWCDTCREEMPSMDKLQRMLGTSDFVILAVASDENWAAVNDFFKGARTAMTLLLDPPNEAGSVAGIAQSWGTTKLPETYLIDKDGNIRYYFVSVRDWTSPKAVECMRALIAE